jgi:K(+)-stimulated pyrophosphate-energized sodium pump
MINGEMFYKKSEPHKASVTGDTVGDPFKDTSGPSMNILIKLMSIVSLVIAPYIAVVSSEGGMGKDCNMMMMGKDCSMMKSDCCKKGAAEMGGSCTSMKSKCDISKCANMTKEECAKMCEEKGCSADEKAYCMSMYGTDGKFVGAKCNMEKCMNMNKEQCAAYCDSMKCSPDEKAMCMKHAGMMGMGGEKECCKMKGAASKCSGENHGCMEGCDHHCKSKEECMKNCGKECADHH